VKCFHHPDVDAVGLCKACGKGLCRSCAVDMGQGLACANSCEVAVRDLIVQLAVSRKALATTPGAYKTQSTIGFVTGGIFVATAALSALTPAWFVAPLLALFGVPMLYQGVRARRTYRALVAAHKELPP
jgi:hypothetical protein